MIWLISILLMIVAIYFLSQGWRNKLHWHGSQLAKHDRDTALELTKTNNERAAKNKLENGASRKPQPIPSDGPSLLYAGKNTSKQRLQAADEPSSNDEQSIPGHDSSNSSAHAQARSENSADANAADSATSTISHTSTRSLLGAGAVVTATATTIAAANAAQHSDAVPNDDFDQAVNDFDKKMDQLDDDDIDLNELGDMTSDISEMLKILNLRETDSPRLDIDTDEYQQLKTGEPGDVEPKKIGVVADRLKTMLD